VKHFISYIIAAAILWMLAGLPAVVSAHHHDTHTEGNTLMADEKATVIEDLQYAFNGESNASAKYAVYAEKAKADGYLAVSALFTAASAAETLHAARHAAVLKAAGVEAKAEIGEYAGKDITEMLQDAIAGETEEFTVMYPEFLQLATAENCEKAVRTMAWAMEVEKHHAALYQAALDLLGHNAAAPIYVCSVCGETVTVLPEKCSVCGALGRAFICIE
jgi:rubrerythrin